MFRNSKLFQRLTGLSIPQFMILAKHIETLWQTSETNRLFRNDRLRSIGGGRSYALNFHDRLIAVLIYVRQYLIQDFIAGIFDINQSNVSRLINKILPLIEEAADPQLKTVLLKMKEASENREKRKSWDEFIREYPDLAAVAHDAAETRCYRPKDKEKQKKYYSGKKKTHTLKIQVSISLSTGRILDVSQTYPGSVHDSKIMDQEKSIEKFPEKTPQFVDLGYQAADKKNPKYYVIVPPKKKKGQELSSLAKELRKAHSKRRVKVEHAIGKMRRLKIFAGIFRGGKFSFSEVTRAVAALVNLKLDNPQQLGTSL